MGLLSSVTGAVGGLFGGNDGVDTSSRSLLSAGQQDIQKKLAEFFGSNLFTDPSTFQKSKGALPGSLAATSNQATRLFNTTPFQRQLRDNISGFDPNSTFAGSDSALSRLLSGQTGSLIGKDAFLSTFKDTVENPLNLSIQQLIERETPAIQQAASAGGSRFSSRVGNTLGSLLQDANRQATSVIGSELGKLEQTRLLANQQATLQAEQNQVAGVGLARQREVAPEQRNAQLIAQEDFFRQLRQQRIQSNLPQFNPLLSSAIGFAQSPTQQIVQTPQTGGFSLGGALGGLLGGQGFGNEIGGLFGAGVPGTGLNVGSIFGAVGGGFG